MIIYKKIKIDYSVLLLLMISLFCGLFKYFMLFYFVIIFHELGHIFYIKMFKCKIDNIKLTIFGGIVKASKVENLSKIKKMLINMGRPDYKYFINSNFKKF